MPALFFFSSRYAFGQTPLVKDGGENVPPYLGSRVWHPRACTQSVNISRSCGREGTSTGLLINGGGRGVEPERGGDIEPWSSPPPGETMALAMAGQD